jgi:hypothetical protein
MQKNFFPVMAFYLLIILNSCTCHNAAAPKEIITTTPIQEDSSVVFIPVVISNAGLSTLIQSKVPDPLVNANTTLKSPVFNSVTVPELWVHKILVNGICDVSKQIRVGCFLNPLGCLTTVVVHEACKVEKEVSEWINKTLIQKVTVDVGTEYMARLNNVHFDGNGDILAIHVVIDFRVKADLSQVAHVGIASCGFDEPMSQLELTLMSKVNLADDGNLRLSEKKWNIEWTRACNLTALDISLESLLNLSGIEKKLESAMDEAVQNKIPNNLDLKPQLIKIWPKISQPFKAGNFGFITLNISELSARNLFVSKDQILSQIGAVCRPVMYLDDDKPESQTTPLPKLTVKSGTDSLNMSVLGKVSFKQLTKYANKTLDLYKYKADSLNVELGGMNLYQHADSLVVEVEFNKPFKGKVYLWGKPKFDLDKNAIMLDNLKLTVESEQIMVKYAGRLAQLKVIERMIADKFVYKYEKNLTTALKQLKDYSQQIVPGMALKINCNVIKPLDIFVSDNYVNVLAIARGQAIIALQ